MPEPLLEIQASNGVVITTLRERFPLLAGAHVKEPEAAVVRTGGQRIAVRGERQARNAVAPSVGEAAQLLAGFQVPEAGEIVPLVVVETAGRHPLAVRREGDAEYRLEGGRQARLRVFGREVADRLAALEVGQVNGL